MMRTNTSDEWIVIFAIELLIVVPFSLIAGLIAPSFSSSVQSFHAERTSRRSKSGVLSSPLLVANWYRTPLSGLAVTVKTYTMFSVTVTNIASQPFPARLGSRMREAKVSDLLKAARHDEVQMRMIVQVPAPGTFGSVLG